MQFLRRIVLVFMSLALLVQFGGLRPAGAKVKEIKIRGYITALASPNSFQIEDYQVRRDASIRIELDHPSPAVSFKPEDLRVGTYVELRGQYNDETRELVATKINVDLRQFRALDETTVLDGKPELVQTEGDKWQGTIIADGRRLRLDPTTKVLFRLNKGEQQEAAKAPKGAKPAATEEDDPNDNDTTVAEQSIGAGPLTSLADIGPGIFMTYQGQEQTDGTVLVSQVVFVRNERTKTESELWKNFTTKETPAIGAKPAELKVGGAKYKVLPNAEVQAYVERVGQSLVPDYQKQLPAGDPNKIPFRFTVVMEKGFNASAFPNGVVVVHDEVFQVLENEAQLAAVLAHEIAHATQEHTYRQREHNKSSRKALQTISVIAAIAGDMALSDQADSLNATIAYGYGRTLENQADRMGLQYMAAAGYDPREAPKVWKLLSKRNSSDEYYWSSQDGNAERRSFQMLSIQSLFSGMNLDELKRTEGDYRSFADLAYTANPKNKKK
jgi:hypothetical protein